MHALKPQLRGQRARLVHQVTAALDAIDMPAVQVIEKQVVKDKAQIGLACAMISHAQARRNLRALRKPGLRQFAQQGFDELVQVINLLELAP